MNNRRNFLGKITGAAALLGFGSLSSKAAPLAGKAALPAGKATTDPDEWFTTNVKGKHKLVVDATEADSIHTFASSVIFLKNNTDNGTPAKDCTVVVVLRAEAFIYALNDSIWGKYKFGEKSKIEDPRTKTTTTRNPYLETKPDDFISPASGPVAMGIRDQQANGVLFCVCDVALKGHAANVAKKLNLDPETVKKEWLDAVIPGIQRMPSGVFAVSRAQEHGCTYIVA